MIRRFLPTLLGGALMALSAPGAQAADGCPNALIRETQGSGHLADCRAYEKVSPAEKNGFGATARQQRASSPSGDSVAYELSGPAPGGPSGDPAGSLVASRDAVRGWSSQIITPPTPPGTLKANMIASYSEDLSKTLIFGYAALTPEATDGADQFYLRDNSTVLGEYSLLTPNPPPVGPIPALITRFYVGGASADYSHVAYQTFQPQTDDPVAVDVFNSYEWVNGNTRLVGVLPDGSLPAGGSVVGSGDRSGSIRHAVSGDGNRIFFHTDGETSGPLYVREDPDGNGPQPPVTTYVSASRRTDCSGDPTCGGDDQPDPQPDPAGPLPATYLDAEAAHGSKALFVSCEKLTDDSTASIPADEQGGGSPCLSSSVGNEAIRGDLYVYDAETGELADITTADPDGAHVRGVIGASDDLSRIYFAADGALAPGAVAGQLNLYAWESGQTTFIAALDRVTDPAGRAPVESYALLKGDRLEKSLVAQVSRDGRYLVFGSRRRLTTHDNSSDACFEGRCMDLYRFDLEANELACVSCAPGKSQGDATLHAREGSAVNTSNVDPPARNITAEGSVFFQTPTPLVGEDSNGAGDVYEWRGGGVRLISDGLAARGASFVDAGPSGDDVFFLTSARLVRADRDELPDLYDARVDGGFPAPVDPPAPCADDVCQGPLSRGPAVGAVGSARPLVSRDSQAVPRASFSVRRLTSVQRAALARGAKVALRVRVNGAGKVLARGKARLGRRVVTVVSSSRRASMTGVVSLRLRISLAARRHIARGGRLRVSLTVKFAGVRQTRTQALSLALAEKPGKARAISTTRRSAP